MKPEHTLWYSELRGPLASSRQVREEGLDARGRVA